MTDSCNLRIYSQWLNHFQQIDRKCGITADDIRRCREFKIRAVHNIQQVNIVTLQGCHIRLSLRNGNSIELTLIETISAGLLQSLEVLHGINITGTQTDIRE